MWGGGWHRTVVPQSPPKHLPTTSPTQQHLSDLQKALRTPRTSKLLTRVVLVDVSAVVVLSTGHTTTTGALAVLADTTFKSATLLSHRDR